MFHPPRVPSSQGPSTPGQAKFLVSGAGGQEAPRSPGKEGLYQMRKADMPPRRGRLDSERDRRVVKAPGGGPRPGHRQRPEAGPGGWKGGRRGWPGRGALSSLSPGPACTEPFGALPDSQPLPTEPGTALASLPPARRPVSPPLPLRALAAARLLVGGSPLKLGPCAVASPCRAPAPACRRCSLHVH